MLASPIDGSKRAVIDNDVLACLLVSSVLQAASPPLTPTKKGEPTGAIARFSRERSEARALVHTLRTLVQFSAQTCTTRCEIRGAQT